MSAAGAAQAAPRTLTLTDREVAARTLALAFHDDPIQQYAFPDPEERARRSPAQFSIFAHESIRHGGALATGDLSGVALWLPPANAPAPTEASQFGGGLGAAMGEEAVTRFGQLLDYITQVHGADAPALHWYLMAIGVLPERRGQGIARTLLEPIFERADGEGLPILLDTAQPKVRPYYERLGFRMTRESVDPVSGIRLWSYLREPQAAKP